MLQAWRTSPWTPSSSAIGAGRIRCSVAQNSLLAPVTPADATLGAPSAQCSASGRGPSAVGTAQVPEKPSAGWITPVKLSRLSDVLRMPVTRVETILQGTPAAVRQMEPEQVAQRLRELCSGLGILPKQAVFMVAKQPSYMLLTPIEEIHTKIIELAVALGVPQAAVLRTAVTIPSILRRSTAVVERRVRAYSTLLRCSPLDVLHVMARGPEYLSDTPSSVRQRMTALGYVLRRPRCTIAAMLQARPDLVFMSGRVSNSKVNGLMCILNKQKHHVVTLIMKLPALLRCNLDAVRHVFGGLQALLQKREGFVYAMVCHAPSLLLLTPRGMHQRCAALRRCLAASSEWCTQFTQLRPPGVAQLVLNRRGSLSVMMYLAQRRRAGAAPLDQLLAPGGGPAAVLGEAWPDFVEWMERRRQFVIMRTRQQRAATQGSAQREVQAGQQIVQHGAGSGFDSSPHPQPPQLPLSAPQQREQQRGALASAAAGTPCPSIGKVGAAAIARAHIAMGGRRAELETIAADAHVQRQGCSTTNMDDRSSSSRTSSSSRRNVESENEGVLQQDADGGAAVDRGQQPGASASGRPPSWHQLQAEYRRTLQSRARRKPAVAAQQGSQDGSMAPTASTKRKPKVLAKARHRAQLLRTGLAAPTAAAVWATTTTMASAQHISSNNASAGTAASVQPVANVARISVLSVAASQSMQPSDPCDAAVGLAAAGGSELQHFLGLGHVTGVSGGGVNLPSEASGRHVLGGMLLSGHGQRSDANPLGMECSTPCTGADTMPMGEALAAQPAASGGSMPSKHMGACMERGPTTASAAVGGPASVQGAGTAGSAPSTRSAASSDADGASCGSHARAVDADARKLPLWLRLDPGGSGSQAPSGGSDGGYAPEHVLHGEVEAPHMEAPEHAATDQVVVVSGAGSIRDITGISRDSHTRGLRGQEKGGGLNIGQAQKLESAYGAAVQR